MKLFGSLTEVVSLVFRKNSQALTVRPNQATTYTASRDHQLPPGDTAHVLLSASSTQTVTGKTIDGDDNIIQDLAITSLKTVIGDANKVLRRDASGIPQSGNTIPNTSALVTTDATQTLTGKSIDGDDNTVSDLAITALKTVLADANKVLRRDASGVPQSGNTIPNTDPLVTTTGTQTLTNKTVSGGTLTGTIASSGATLQSPILQTPNVDDYVDVNEEASPATPASGKVRVYAKTDKKLYKKDSNGTETEIGAGTGGVNLIPNPDFETGAAADWTVSDADIGITASATTPLRGTYSGSIVATAAVDVGDYAQVPFTLPLEFAGRVMRVAFYFEAGSGYDAADARVVIRDITNSVDITPSTTSIPGNSGKFEATWLPSSSTSYAIRIYSNVATTWTLKVDDFEVNDSKVLVGMSGSDFIDASTEFTFAPGFGTTTNVKIFRRRVGDSMEVYGTFQPGTTLGTTAYIQLPTGLVVDSAKITTLTNKQIVGQSWNIRTAASTSMVNDNKGVLFYDGSTTNQLFFTYEAGSSQLTKASSSSYSNSNEPVSFTFRVPISGWSSNIQIAERAVEEFASNTSSTDAADTTSFTNAVSGAVGVLGVTNLTTIRKKRVRFQTTIQPTDTLLLEVDFGGVGRWFPVGYTVLNNNDAIEQFHVQNTGTYGMAMYQVNSTDVDVTFGQYGIANGTTFGAAGKPWSNADYASSRWRVRKVSGGAIVGYPVSTNNVLGATDGTAAAAGYIGERISATITADTTTTVAGTEIDVTGASISVTPGRWLFYFGTAVNFNNPTGATTAPAGRIRVTDASNNALTGGAWFMNPTLGAGLNQTFNASWIVPATISTTTTYKLRVTSSVSTATGHVRFIGTDQGAFSGQDNDSYFYAVRIG